MVIRKSIAVLIVFSVCTAFAQEGLRPGVQAPDFTLPSVMEKSVSLKEAVAKGVVILHFWKSK
jgi:hypothetical protein